MESQREKWHSMAQCPCVAVWETVVSSLTFTFPNGLEKSKSLHNFPGVGLQGECGLWTFIHEGDEVDLSQLNGASSFSLLVGGKSVFL